MISEYSSPVSNIIRLQLWLGPYIFSVFMIMPMYELFTAEPESYRTPFPLLNYILLFLELITTFFIYSFFLETSGCFSTTSNNSINISQYDFLHGQISNLMF